MASGTFFDYYGGESDQFPFYRIAGGTGYPKWLWTD